MLEDFIDLVKEWWGFVLFVIVFFLVVGTLGVTAERHKRRPEVFQAWQKLNPSAQLTYEEWASLYQSNLLPGMGKDETLSSNEQYIHLP